MKDNRNLLVIDGGNVKTNEEGVVFGKAIVFGSPKEPDRSSMRDFFTNESIIQKKSSFTVPLFYNHGIGPIREQIGEAVITKAADGWDTTAILDLTDDSAQKVYEFVKDKPHGFSTGALSHLVVREAKDNDTNFLKQWVVGELSLTERPAERRAVVQAVKSVDGELVYEEAFDTTTEDTMGEKKDMETLIAIYDENGNKIWDIESGEPLPKEGEAKSIEIKDVNGSVSYSLSSFDYDEGTGFNVNAYVYGGEDSIVTAIQAILDAARSAQVQDDLEDATEGDAITTTVVVKSQKDFDERVEKAVKSALAKLEDDKKASELKTQLEEVEQKLADAELKASESEDALTKAREDIARLEILAGAKETIKQYKGK